MSIFSNSIFKPISNYIKFGNQNITVQNGANVLEKLNLCNVKINYKQYQKTTVTIPPGQTDFVLSFPMLGIKSTFIAIKATYKNNDPNKNFLKWKFNSSVDPYKSMTNILVFSGTTTNPIEPLILENPSNCSVDLEILISGTDNDYLNDVSAFLYLNDLEFDNIQTFNQINSETLAYYNSDNELVGTTDTSDVINWYLIPNINRIIIDESSNNNIILDFKTQDDARQALSAINWLMLDPTNRSLPKGKDLTPPVINTTNTTLSIDLTNYPSSIYTKDIFISEIIHSIVDNIDGPMIAIPQNIRFLDVNNNNNEVLNISSEGIYEGVITIKDIAGNESTTNIPINAVYNLIDTIPPTINYSNYVNINNMTIDSFDLVTDYGGVFTRTDAKLLWVFSIYDITDGPISLSNLTVNFYDSNSSSVQDIITPGIYTIEFSVSDSAGNQTFNNFQIQIN